MMEGEEPAAGNGDERAALLREIEACSVRLRFLTVAGYDADRVGPFRQELNERRDRALESLAALTRHPDQR